MQSSSNTEGQAVALLVLPPDLWKWGMLDLILAAEETKKRWQIGSAERRDDDDDDDNNDDDDHDDDDDCDGDGFVHESSD